MIKSKKLVGMPVISLAEGNEIGKVKELVVNPVDKVVAALIIEQKGWFKEQKFIPYGKVRSVGTDAITIDQSSNVQKSTSLPEILKLTKDRHTVTGAKVVAENGTVLGIVEEYYVDIDNGTIVGLEISGNFISSIMGGKAFIDSSFIQTFGRQLLIANNESSEHLIKIDSGLSETMKSIKDTSSTLWESTVVKTKEMTSTLNKKIEELRSKNSAEHTEGCQCGQHHESAKECPRENASETVVEKQKEEVKEAQKNNHENLEKSIDKSKSDKPPSETEPPVEEKTADNQPAETSQSEKEEKENTPPSKV